VIVISGQVNSNLSTNHTGLNLRQLGDQEFDIVKMVSSITKYAVQVNDPQTIRYHLEKACKLATTGRPGPVWLDIPLDIQSQKIDPNTLAGFTEVVIAPTPDETILDNIITQLNKSTKPLIVAGNGIRLSNGLGEFASFLEKNKLPVITAINGNDVVNKSYKYYYGRFGTHAQVCANKILGECDFLLVIGARLNPRQTGYNFERFAENAYKVYVDIDENELNKPTLFPDVKILADAKEFLTAINNKLNLTTNLDHWYSRCDELYSTPRVLDRHREKQSPISNYLLIEALNDHLPSDYHVVTSDGSANVITMQVLNLQGGQRLITNTGCAPMGYGLPAAIGASFNNKILCIEGDGSIHLNIH
ncbi:thiamine pyrophosphate-binding protein, partial [bacterium]|nr:thiamine pyrophosphate-binding protein [bacterium]